MIIAICGFRLRLRRAHLDGILPLAEEVTFRSGLTVITEKVSISNSLSRLLNGMPILSLGSLHRT